MKLPKRNLKVVPGADEVSKVNADAHAVQSKNTRPKFRPVSVSMPDDEIQDLARMVGGWQQFFISRSGGKATRLGRSDVLRAAAKKFKDMDHEEALEALLVVFPDDTPVS